MGDPDMTITDEITTAAKLTKEESKDEDFTSIKNNSFEEDLAKKGEWVEPIESTVSSQHIENKDNSAIEQSLSKQNIVKDLSSSKVLLKESCPESMNESKLEEDPHKAFDEFTEEENLKFLSKIFEEAQNSLANHSTHSKAILKRFTDPSVLYWYLEHFVRMIFLQGKPSPQVVRCVKFIVKISTCISNGRQFADVLVDKLLKYCMMYWNCKNKQVRRQICNLVGAMLNGLEEDWEIDDDVWSMLQHLLLFRLKDKSPQVRKSAAIALKRLQNPELKMECPVQKGLCELMDHDKSKEVRLEALKRIDMNGDSLLAIYRRLRDQDENVRAFTYERLRKVACNALSIKDRVNAINTGLKDRSSKVKRVCSNLLIKSWFKSSKMDILQFLSILDPEQYESECELIVKHLLENGAEISGAQPPYQINDLSVESVLYWRTLVDWLQEKEDREGLNHVLPTLSNYTELLHTVKQKEFIAWQLLKMAKHLEYFDEFGRAALTEELLSMLKDKSLTNELMPFVTKVLRKCIANEDEFIRQVIENVINEIRDPIEERESDEVLSKRKDLVEKLQSVYTLRDVARNEKKEAVESENFAEAEKAKKSVLEFSAHIEILEDELQKLQKSDQDTWKRVLIIISDLLEYTRQPISHPFLQPLLDTTLNTAIGHSDPEIREPGLLAFGLYCLMDKGTAKGYMPLFAQVLQHDLLALKYLALKIVFDLFTVYNFIEPSQESINHETNTDVDDYRGGYAPSITRILEILSSFLAHNDQDLLACTVEGFCKLLLLSRLPMNQEEVLSHLILLYFNIHTEENEQIRQCLALFFPYFVSGKKNDGNRRLVLKCFMPCLREVAYASAASPFYNANISMLAEFILSLLTVDPTTSLDLTQITIASAVHFSSHESVVFDVLFEIEASTDDWVALPFCKVLPVLTIDPAQQENIKQYKVLLKGIMKRLKKKNCLNYLRRFKEILSASDSLPEEELPASLLEDLETRKVIAIEKIRKIYEAYAQIQEETEDAKPVKRSKKRKHKKPRASQRTENADRPRKRKRIMSDEPVKEKPFEGTDEPKLEVQDPKQSKSKLPTASEISNNSDPPLGSSDSEPDIASKRDHRTSSSSSGYNNKRSNDNTPLFKRFPNKALAPSGRKMSSRVKKEVGIPKRKSNSEKLEEDESEEDEIDKFIASTANEGVTDPGLEALLSDSDESS